MILVADSGSTKCDWALLTEQGFESFSTQGFNPMFHNKQMVIDGLRVNTELMRQAPNVSAIFYYGAGCQNAVLNKIIEDALKEIFTKARIAVDHDLTAAIRATCGDESGISCILGTGSNLAYFNGSEIITKTSGLGYVLGDEGSGTFFGKQLLADFLYEKLPASIHNELRDVYKLDKDVIIKNVYMKPHANVYLAQFMRIISSHRDEKYVQQLIYNGLLRFIDVHVARFDECHSVPVHFVGSIAFHFKEVLDKACQQRHIHLGKVVQKPIENLVEYHRVKVDHA
ncbi:N-acetylglucosamine kinase [bacterium]|nr:N-acetylglucosamine kinase [bacterium]